MEPAEQRKPIYPGRKDRRGEKQAQKTLETETGKGEEGRSGEESQHKPGFVPRGFPIHFNYLLLGSPDPADYP